MDYTYLDYFNYYLKEYINELINTFPETQEPLLANYRSFLEGRDDKNDIYAKCFYTKINNFLVSIAKRDETLFETSGKIFIEGVDLYNIWNNSLATEQTHIAIWKYLQILMILGRKIIPNHKEIVELLQKISNGEINIPTKVEKTLTTDEKNETEENPGVFGLGDIASSLGGLGNLASSLGLDNIGSTNGIGNLISGITEMFKNPEFTNAMSQLSQSMASQATNPVVEEEQQTTENTSQSKSISNYDGTNCPPMDEKGTSGQEGSNTNNIPQQPPQQPPQPTPLFNNPLFGDLAKELTETFNFEEMEKDGKPANIGDAIGKFMSGNNPAKLMNLVGKFGSKLQQEVQRGTINPTELLQQTMGAMSGAGGNMEQNMANMMQNMARNPQVQQMVRNQSTRDRLRAKLNKKNNEKQ
jgi:hypothetical protein